MSSQRPSVVNVLRNEYSDLHVFVIDNTSPTATTVKTGKMGQVVLFLTLSGSNSMTVSGRALLLVCRLQQLNCCVLREL